MDINFSGASAKAVRFELSKLTGFLSRLSQRLSKRLLPCLLSCSLSHSLSQSLLALPQILRHIGQGALLRKVVFGVIFAILNPNAFAAESDDKSPASPETGIFLVATEQLENTSFAQTVILITHNSEKGAAGLAINRPSQYHLNELFPKQSELRRHADEVFLGGPVQADSIFVLMRTRRPHKGMYQVAKDLYFAAGLDALSHGLKNLGDKEIVRAYVGFSGWAPGQLDQEIERGDWLVVHANTDIIFDQDNGSVWQRLYKTWTGQWI